MSARNPWPIAATVILPTFMEVLDVSITNVSLDHIAGSLSASYDQATWVVTSYLIANAIVLPTTGWLSRRFGQKRVLETCLAAFTIASVCCGLATSLPMLLIMRVVQGLGGGALQPISMAILMESFPQEKQGQAVGLYGFGVVIAPIVGPLLGGWLTDAYSWRWVFYINLPVGVLAQALVRRIVPDHSPTHGARATSFDSIGFLLMATWLACQEVCLDKGQEQDWLASSFIRTMAAIAVVSLAGFVWRELHHDQPVVDLRILRHRNFAVGISLMTAVGACLFGMIAVLPLFLQTLMGYTAYQSGVAMLPRGIGALAAMPLAGQLVNRVDARALVATGFLLFALSCWQMAGLNLDMSMWTLLWPLLMNGVSLAFLFVSVNTVALGPLPAEETGNGTGIINLMRNVGGSVGVSSVVTVLARRAQVHQTTLVSHLSPFDLVARAVSHHLPVRALYHQLVTQAMLLSYVDLFLWSAALGGACALLTIAMQRVNVSGPVAIH